MNKSFLFNGTPCVFVQDTSDEKSRTMTLYGICEHPRPRSATSSLSKIVLNQKDAKAIRDELGVIKLLIQTLEKRQSRVVRLEKYDLDYSKNRLTLISSQVPGRPSIELQSLFKTEKIQLPEKWYLEGFIERFISLLDSFLKEEDLTPHQLEKTISGGAIELFEFDGDDGRTFHLIRESGDGISYRILNRFGDIAFAIRDEVELLEMANFAEDVKQFELGAEFAKVLNSKPKSLMTCYHAGKSPYAKTVSIKSNLIVVQTSISLLRRMRIYSRPGIGEDFANIAKRIEQIFNTRYVKDDNGNLKHIDLNVGVR